MTHLWHNDSYIPLNTAKIKPVLRGTVIGEVLITPSDGEQFSVSGEEAKKVLDWIVRTNVSSIAEQPQTNSPAPLSALPTTEQRPTGKKRVFNQDSLDKMAARRAEYWAKHPERRSAAWKKANNISE